MDKFNIDLIVNKYEDARSGIRKICLESNESITIELGEDILQHCMNKLTNGILSHSGHSNIIQIRYSIKGKDYIIRLRLSGVWGTAIELDAEYESIISKNIGSLASMSYSFTQKRYVRKQGHYELFAEWLDQLLVVTKLLQKW